MLHVSEGRCVQHRPVLSFELEEDQVSYSGWFGKGDGCGAGCGGELAVAAIGAEGVRGTLPDGVDAVDLVESFADVPGGTEALGPDEPVIGTALVVVVVVVFPGIVVPASGIRVELATDRQEEGAVSAWACVRKLTRPSGSWWTSPMVTR